MDSRGSASRTRVGTQMDPFHTVQYSKLFYPINWQTRRKAFNRETAFIKYGSSPPPSPLHSVAILPHAHTFFFLLSLAEFYCVMYLTISRNFFFCPCYSLPISFRAAQAFIQFIASHCMWCHFDVRFSVARLLSRLITYYHHTCFSFFFVSIQQTLPNLINHFQHTSNYLHGDTKTLCAPHHNRRMSVCWFANDLW